jgi:hypothetical protein
MIIYFSEETDKEYKKQGIRTHPWDFASHDSSQRFYDFVANPELIETSLEDFLPFSHYQATRTFYSLLRWVNGMESILETNDCAFAFEKNKNQNSPEIAKQKFRANGRVMIFFREHILNTINVYDWFTDTLCRKIRGVDNGFTLGVVAFSHPETRYINLSYPLSEAIGYELSISFWAWGMTEDETFQNLDRLFQNLLTAIKETSELANSEMNIKEIVKTTMKKALGL